MKICQIHPNKKKEQKVTKWIIADYSHIYIYPASSAADIVSAVT